MIIKSGWISVGRTGSPRTAASARMVSGEPTAMSGPATGRSGPMDVRRRAATEVAACVATAANVRPDSPGATASWCRLPPAGRFVKMADTATVGVVTAPAKRAGPVLTAPPVIQ